MRTLPVMRKKSSRMNNMDQHLPPPLHSTPLKLLFSFPFSHSLTLFLFLYDIFSLFPQGIGAD